VLAGSCRVLGRLGRVRGREGDDHEPDYCDVHHHRHDDDDG
jgi:hypothetical protein